MKKNAKVLQKLLSDENSEFVLIDYLDRMLHYKLTENKEMDLVPKNRNKYVGIEVECFSNLDDKKVMALVLEHDLEEYINIGDDGSIETDDYDANTYEFRILSTEKELPKVFKRLTAFFKAGKFKANYSCGVHVHLDMRHRDVEKCYSKLLRFQQILFPLVKKDRWINEYCDWSLENDKVSRRMTAINYTAYSEHQTLEVRLHHGTTDVSKIENWVRLLLKAIKSTPIKEIKSKKDAVKWAGKDKKLKTYITKEFNSGFFKKKNEILLGYDGQNEGNITDMIMGEMRITTR